MKRIFFLKGKARDRLSGKAGFTLVEVIVTLVIMGIIIAISGSLIISGTNIFSKSAQRDMQINIAEEALDFASGQLLYAYTVEEGDKNTGGLVDYTGVSAPILQIMRNGKGDSVGQLYFRRAGDEQFPVNVFGPGFYHDYDVQMVCSINVPEDGGNAYFTLDVTLYNNLGNDVLTRSTTKPLLNYTGTEKTIGTSGNFIIID